MTEAESIRKRPESTYSRRNRPVVLPATQDCAVTDANFAQKVLEVLKPNIAPSISPSSEDEGEEEEGEELKRHCVRNVHELLESGTSNRLYDELDYLVSGLESHSSVKDTARHQYLMDLGDKLFGDMTPMRTSRVRSSGLLERIVKRAGSDDYGRKFQITLLYLLCADVRRIDHYINVIDGCELGTWLLGQEGILRSSFKGQSGDTNIRSKVNDISTRLDRLVEKTVISNVQMLDLGIWMFAKLVLAAQTASSEQRDLSRQLVERVKEHLGLLCVNLDRVDLVRTSRILFVLEFLALDPAVHNVIIDSVISLISKSFERPDLVSSCVRLLVSLTGPDESSAHVASRKESVLLVKDLLAKVSLNKEDVELQSLVCTLVVNIVDRHPVSRTIFIEDSNLMSDIIETILSPDNQASPYYGMLMGILLFDSASSRIALLSTNQTLEMAIFQSFTHLIEQLTSNRRITPTLCNQLQSFQSIYSHSSS
jgi:hypothetical protein